MDRTAGTPSRIRASGVPQQANNAGSPGSIYPKGGNRFQNAVIRGALESLVNSLDRFDFAVFVFTPDDTAVE